MFIVEAGHAGRMQVVKLEPGLGAAKCGREPQHNKRTSQPALSRAIQALRKKQKSAAENP